jgi:hypothetical protein
LQQVYERLLRFCRGDATAARSDAERKAFASSETPPADDADFMLFLMRRYDKGFRFWADVGNVGNRMTMDCSCIRRHCPASMTPGRTSPTWPFSTVT